MLVYKNQPFGTDNVQTHTYRLRMPLAGGQLSCEISSIWCLNTSVRVCTWLNHAAGKFTGENTLVVQPYMQNISGAYVHGMYIYIHCMHMYIPCMYMV